MISIGVDPKLGDEFNDRLKVLNAFTWTCMLFSIPYYIIMFALGNPYIGLLFVFNQLSYSLSLWLNKFSYFNTSKFLILITTNYSVLMLNFAFGFEAGFYLYYFTAPLIVFSFFNFHQYGKNIASLALYISSYFIAYFAFKNGYQPWKHPTPEMTEFLFSLNVILAFIFIIVLASNFSKFHLEASLKISNKNDELEQNKLELEKLLKEKNTLVSEIHHRVKNNLAVITGLFDLQLMSEDDARLKAILTNSKNRIKSMSLIHEALYNQPSVSGIDFKIYIETLVKEIQNSLQSDKIVKFNIEINNVVLDLSKAIPCGIIVNEVITNSFKHAFSNTENPEITVKMELSDHYLLCISDNGSGHDFSITSRKNSLGISIIEALSDQLEGTFSFENENGYKFCLNFN